MRGDWQRLTCCAGFLPFPDDGHMIRRLQTDYPSSTQRILGPMIPGVGGLQFVGSRKQLVLVSAIPETAIQTKHSSFPPPLATASPQRAPAKTRLPALVSRVCACFRCHFQFYFIPPKVKSTSARCPSIAITRHPLFVSAVLLSHRIISAGLLNFQLLLFSNLQDIVSAAHHG